MQIKIYSFKFMPVRLEFLFDKVEEMFVFDITLNYIGLKIPTCLSSFVYEVTTVQLVNTS